MRTAALVVAACFSSCTKETTQSIDQCKHFVPVNRIGYIMTSSFRTDTFIVLLITTRYIPGRRAIAGTERT